MTRLRSGSRYFTKKGNTAGFTADGRHVCGEYAPKIKAWRVWAEAEIMSLANPTLRTFADVDEADAYADTLIDSEKTAELKWWN